MIFSQEHMDEVCSSQLLTSVRRMVLTLTQQNDESKEFVKFFHKQLGSILQVRVYTYMAYPLVWNFLLSFSGSTQFIQIDIHSGIHWGRHFSTF